MNDSRNWIILILLLLAGYFAFMLYTRPPIPLHDDRPLQDSITHLLASTKTLQASVDSLTLVNTDLANQKVHIQTVFKDKLVFIHTASAHQLDSLIRSLW